MGDENKKKKPKNTCKNFKGKTYCSPGAYKRAIAKKNRQAKKDARKSERLNKKNQKNKEVTPPVEYTEKSKNPRFL